MSAVVNGAGIAQQLSSNEASAAAATADQSGSDSQAQHYDAVAATYESAFFYSSVEYRDWVMGHLLRHFRLPDEVGSQSMGLLPVPAARALERAFGADHCTLDCVNPRTPDCRYLPYGAGG